MARRSRSWAATIVHPKDREAEPNPREVDWGGENYQLSKGDVEHIPANVRHELRIPSGKTFTYLVIKVDSK